MGNKLDDSSRVPWKEWVVGDVTADAPLRFRRRRSVAFTYHTTTTLNNHTSTLPPRSRFPRLRLCAGVPRRLGLGVPGLDAGFARVGGVADGSVGFVIAALREISLPSGCAGGDDGPFSHRECPVSKASSSSTLSMP